jgi:hypothetical protein
VGLFWETKTDPSLQSVLSALKNPNNIPVRRFVLKADEKGGANLL